MHVVLLAIPPQAHGDKSQQDEHHHSQNTAHNPVEQPSRRAGWFLRVGAWWGDGVLAGRPRRLTCCSRERRGEKKEEAFLASSTKQKNNRVPPCKMQAIVVGPHKNSLHLCCVIMELMPVIKPAAFAETCLEK